MPPAPHAHHGTAAAPKPAAAAGARQPAAAGARQSSSTAKKQSSLSSLSSLSKSKPRKAVVHKSRVKRHGRR